MRLPRRRNPALPRVLAAVAVLLALAGFVPGVLGATAAYARPAAVPVRLAVPVLPPAAVPAAIPPRLYAVRAGDTLSSVARRLCGHAASWRGIYAASRAVVGPDPDLILPGQRLTVACSAPPALLAASVRHAAARRAAGDREPDCDADDGYRGCHAAAHGRRPAAAVVSYGIYSYGALERLWISAGGPAWAAAHAAEIAGCESGGNPRAYNPSGATGLWQILGSVVAGNLYNPFVNALNAVAKFRASGDTFAQWVCR